ncbi:helix-turn-helix transcriptional regulator [Halococcus saccharolyticus]|uniref:Transcriptional regulator-like protein n=1 Tax=Halococcus saccharolyticus DSM 5350 TaxID=1227455 RepID=M0MGF6_9EURY|nr:helix-turn-helix domain-containing protein [Halococcus saccharolyticus]EMA44791.1 transcriptional regulator-like protein [Halococcus saccharolyticus DSM 5350]
MTALDNIAALDDIAFLARSASRVRVLETLIEGPHDRAELQAATGIPRATVGRIVTEFEARGWVVHDGHHYRTSPLGGFLVAEFRALVEGVGTMQKLRGVIEWLPTDEFDFSLDRFADADITLPKPSDTIAPVERAAELVAAGEDVSILAFGSAPQVVEAGWRTTVNGVQSFEVVFAAETLDAVMTDPDVGTWLRELAACERGSVYRYEGTVPYNLAVIDDTANFALINDQGAPSALIETADPTIRSWVVSTLDNYRREAEALDADALGS